MNIIFTNTNQYYKNVNCLNVGSQTSKIKMGERSVKTEILNAFRTSNILKDSWEIYSKEWGATMSAKNVYSLRMENI